MQGVQRIHGVMINVYWLVLVRKKFSSLSSSSAQYLPTTNSPHSVHESMPTLSLQIAWLVLHSISCICSPEQFQWTEEPEKSHTCN